MSELDPRYAAIKPLYRKRKIKSFLDIFKFVPKTVVAMDTKKNVSRLSEQLTYLESFTLADLFLIGGLCDLSETEVLKLVTKEFSIRENKKKKKS